MTDNAVHWLIAISIALLGGTGTVVGWLAAKKFEAYDQQHQDHYRHAAQADVHWTSRERDDLTRKLADMGDDIKELLRRNGGARGN